MSSPGAAGSSARLWFALILALVLGGVALALILGSRDGGSEALAEAPGECVRDWNADAVAREQGRHNRAFHLYESAQVGYLAEGTEIAADPSAGPCAVVFPRGELDPEPEFAGFAIAGGEWEALSASVSPEALARLQSLAVPAVNATLNGDGKLLAR